MHSEAILISNPTSPHASIINLIKKRIEGYITATKFMMISYNVAATNLEALRNGCFTAGTQREFAKNNPVFKTNPKSSVVDRSDIMAADDLAQYTFGIRSEPNEVPIRELLRCSDPSVGEIDYPDRSHRNLKGRLPDAKPTKSSKLFEKHIKHHYGDKQKPSLFKLARFVKVESKVKEMMQ